MGRPGPLADHAAAGPHMRNAPASSYLLAEFTYPILPPHEGGAMWFYSLPEHDGLCHAPEKIYRDYRGAVCFGNIFSLDVGPDHAGRLREIDVRTLRRVGEMIRNPPPPSLVEGRPVTASSTWGPGYEAAMAFDGDDATRWGAAPDARSGWLEVDLGAPVRIGGVVVRELAYQRTREFVIECGDGGAWQELARGTTIGGEKRLGFPPVTARRVRLNILQAAEVPTIEEFEVLPADPDPS